MHPVWPGVQGVPEIHTILGGKVRIYRRETGNNWYCSTYMGSKERRKSTKEESRSRAKEFAEDWYLTLRGKQRGGNLLSERTLAQAADAFQTEHEVITEGQRSAKWVDGHKARIRLHLLPFFGKLSLSQVTAGRCRITVSRASRIPSAASLPITYRIFRTFARRGGFFQNS